MNTWLIILIVVVLGFIFGNILLLKHSANFKFEKLKDKNPEDKNKTKEDP